MFPAGILKTFLFCVFFVYWSDETATCPITLVTDFNQKTCTDQSTNDTAYYYDYDRQTCMPKCSVYPTEVDSSSCTIDPTVCLTGYSCEKRCGTQPSIRNVSCEVNADCSSLAPRARCLKYCVLPTTSGSEVTCMAYHANLPEFVATYWTAQKFKPTCDNDGNWLPKQCKGGYSGRCLCYSSKGQRLFGQALYSRSENMTCACSRKKSDLEASGRAWISLHCDSTGNYETLQCDIEKEFCWCAEPRTGDLTAPVVPEKAKYKLPCYVASTLGSQYLRQCESKKFAQSIITAKLKARGAKYVDTDTLLCDGDGGYGAYMVSSGIAYCTWRDNSKIGTWQSNMAASSETLTCNCARDFKMYAHRQDCMSSGDYYDIQHYDENGKRSYYCVDNDGFAKTDLFKDSTTDCSTFY